MSELNADRSIVRIIRDAAADHGVRVESFGEGWILRLSRAETVRFLYGYGFDLNSAATHAIACDKAATSDLLAAQRIPCVEHKLFLHPRMAPYVVHKGNWEAMLRFAREHRFDIVAKDNGGTGGRGVYRVRSEVELEHATYKLFEHTHAIALSPFYDAQEEHRFVIVAGKCEVAYTKQRPMVTGDGRRTVLEILAERMTHEGAAGPVARLIANMDEATAGLGDVLPAGVTRLLNWRHNLGQGATVKLLDPSKLAGFRPLTIALDAARSMNLVFGSVDVIEAKDGARVLEVNSGLMMEFLTKSVEGGYDLAKRVYRRAFELMFA